MYAVSSYAIIKGLVSSYSAEAINNFNEKVNETFQQYLSG